MTTEKEDSIQKQAEEFAEEMKNRLPHEIVNELLRYVRCLESTEPDAGMESMAKFMQSATALMSAQGFGMTHQEAVDQTLKTLQKKGNVEETLLLETLNQFKKYGIKRALEYIKDINDRLSPKKLHRMRLFKMAKTIEEVPEWLVKYLSLMYRGREFTISEVASHEEKSYTGPEYWGGPRTHTYHTTGISVNGTICLPKNKEYKEKMRTGDLVAISTDRKDWEWNGSYYFVHMHFLAHIPWNCPSRKWEK